MSNAALFSTVAREYANFRPGYPAGLFAWQLVSRFGLAGPRPQRGWVRRREPWPETRPL